MRKRIIIFFCVSLLLLALPVGFSFATEECDHDCVDDTDCTTPVVCTKCNETVVEAKEHNFSTTLSYTLQKTEDGMDDFFVAGTKRVRCSNSKCYTETTMEVQPFVTALGYSLKEDTYNVTNKDGSVSEKTEATIISTFLFNTTEIEEYAKLKKQQILYGTFLYRKDALTKGIVCKECNFLYDGVITVAVTDDDGSIEYEQVKTAWKDVPDTYTCPDCGAAKSVFYEILESPINGSTGRFHQNVYLPNKGEAGRINDISIMKIDEGNYNAELIISAYVIIGNSLYYVQNNKFIGSYMDLVSVTCDKILEQLNEQ